MISKRNAAALGDGQDPKDQKYHLSDKKLDSIWMVHPAAQKNDHDTTSTKPRWSVSIY